MCIPDAASGVTVSNGWKVWNRDKNKWYAFSCKTPEDKQLWMDAFR